MQKIRKIIVLRFRRVGDAILSSTVCSTLRKTFPDAEIVYVLNAEIAPLFEHHPDIDRVVTFSKSELKDMNVYLKKVRRIMHEEDYDMIVDLRSTVKTLWFSLFSLKTPYRVGVKKAYNLFIHNYRSDTAIEDDEIGRIQSILSSLEKKFEIRYERIFNVYVTPEEKESFRRTMEAKGINFAKPVIVCAVVTRLAHKMWDKKQMMQILKLMIEKYDAQLVFNFGGKEEEESAKQIHHEMNNHPAIFTNIKADRLTDLAAMLANADFFFGNEGGPRHISQALNVPSFAIYPPFIVKKYWLPNTDERFQGIEPEDILEDPDEKLSYADRFRLITTEEVWKRLNPMLKRLVSEINR
jgi:heptosyltransferase-2